MSVFQLFLAFNNFNCFTFDWNNLFKRMNYAEIFQNLMQQLEKIAIKYFKPVWDLLNIAQTCQAIIV